ncbi:MAG: uroporphyrinogen decarboxylase [Chloroflexi bacterium HGW-Chloroflexi-3]|nr:MAG: uroporphyrinogen decarboxylase [Chloroflexi bacterium HGW-Chloroflexi-3]
MENKEPQFTFLRACRKLPVDYTPIWFMRQAGRYMAEYRKIREKYTLLEICAIPELATEVTLQPIHTFEFDAAILFADILLPLIPMGINLEFAASEGPVIHNPVRTAEDVGQLRKINPHEDLAHVLKAIDLITSELAGKTPLIGFAGAPFTLASYLIEGGPSKNFLKTKGLMVEQPQVWEQLMNLLAEVVADFLLAQIESGAQAIQLFDSWAGSALSPEDYKQYALPYSQKIFNKVRQGGVPAVHFSVGAGTYLPLIKEAGGDVIGLDWRTPIDWGRNILGMDVAVQGNLDPAALFAPKSELKKKIQTILDRANNQPGHIFNLGHGILPQTPVDNVKAAVDMVHELSQRKD